MDLGLKGRVCVVTGALPRGGARARTSISLAAEGATVVLVGRREEGLFRHRPGVSREAGGQAATVVLDVTHPRAGERLLDVCLGRLERLDVLVNNAGTSAVRSLEQLTDEEWQAQWELHVMAPMRLMRTIAPRDGAAGVGEDRQRHLLIGQAPRRDNMAYNVSKAAELSLSRSFADLYADRGVLVNAVAPGAVSSELWTGPGGLADQVAQAQGSRGRRRSRRRRAAFPSAAGTEEEIAAVITFLASELASNVVGAAWSVDGGAVPEHHLTRRPTGRVTCRGDAA